MLESKGLYVTKNLLVPYKKDSIDVHSHRGTIVREIDICPGKVNSAKFALLNHLRSVRLSNLLQRIPSCHVSLTMMYSADQRKRRRPRHSSKEQAILQKVKNLPWKSPQLCLLASMTLLCYVFVVATWTYSLGDINGRRVDRIQSDLHYNQPKRTLTNLRMPSPDQSHIQDPDANDTDMQPMPQNNDHGRWFWIGIVRDAKEVQESTWDALAHAACSEGVNIHVTVGKNTDHALDQFVTRRIVPAKMAAEAKCGSVYLESEQDIGVLVLPENRVDRIAMIRDAQRLRVRELWLKDRQHDDRFNADVVIVADLDLFRLPSVQSVLSQAHEIVDSDDLDVVCAAGVTVASRNELWYYDTYATILLPDTYVHPLKRRLKKEFYAGENHSLVRSDNQHGAFTQGDLMRYIQENSQSTGTLRVRSCFGGVAIYRATTWFDEHCSYTQNEPDRLMRYVSEQDSRACEHVAFHTCLQDIAPEKATVAINPNMLTLWRKN